MDEKNIRKYEFDNENDQAGSVEEPFSGYGIYQEEKMDEIISNDELNCQQKPFPCEFTSEEKWAILELARKDEAGGNFTPQEQVMNRYKNRFS